MRLRKSQACGETSRQTSAARRCGALPTGAELYEHTIVSRAERKQRTRNHLLESALRLMEEGPELHEPRAPRGDARGRRRADVLLPALSNT